MTLQARPEGFHAAAHCHFGSRGIVKVPLPGQPGVGGHGTAGTEAPAALTVGATEARNIAGQMSYGGIPLVVPAAAVDAAWAAQPHPLPAPVGVVCGCFALVAGGVPQVLYAVVVWVRQRFTAVLIQANICTTLAGYVHEH